MSAPVNEITARMPWLYAEGGSWWSVTGSFAPNHTFQDCIAQAVPEHITGIDQYDEVALFRVYIWGGEPRFVAADRVTRGKRLVFVLADEPRRAYYDDEQEFIDQERPA